MDNTQYVPEQVEGKETDVVAEQMLSDMQSAQHFFIKVKERLLNVNNWHKICKIEASTFTLVDENATRANSLAKVGHYLKIDIPGPGSSVGGGFDWVKIESIEEIINEKMDKEVLVMRVRPAMNPEKPAESIAHFLNDKATSTFIVARQGNLVASEVHGRNEIPNTSTNNLLDKVRNVVIGTGALLGISILQWKLLTEGIISLSKKK